MPQSYSFTAYITTLLTDFMALLYPEVCISCGEVLERSDRHICLSCTTNLPETHFEKNPENPVAKLFWGKIAVENASAGYFFRKKTPFQKIIHSFKYHGNVDAAIFMGEMLGRRILHTPFMDCDCIIPVPLHPDKLKIRGYNQAEKIADGISLATSIPVDTHSLLRMEANESQTRKSLFVRWTNVENIFHVAEPENLRNAHVLLVDDVITSGSTIEACARKILEVEGAKVSILTLAIASQ